MAHMAHTRHQPLHSEWVDRAAVGAMHEENPMFKVSAPNTEEDILAILDASVNSTAFGRPEACCHRRHLLFREALASHPSPEEYHWLWHGLVNPSASYRGSAGADKFELQVGLTD